ncbi:MAG: hypothetical protein ABJB12_17215 [Pseudomonadota bacterium]
MRHCSSALLVVVLWGCRQAAPVPTKPAGDSPRPQPPGSTAAPPSPAALAFGLVASGKHLALAIMGDEAKVARVRVWNDSFSAHAPGDGTLVADQEPEQWTPAPFEPRTQTLVYASNLLSSFAFRRDNVPCLVKDGSTLLVLKGKKWREKRLPERTLLPQAFLAWDGGALFVDSPVGACGWATSSAIERLDQPTGTVFTQVSSNGATSHPSLDLDPSFMAWAGSRAEQSLALVGTFGIRAEPAPGEDVVGTRDIAVMRRHAQGPFKATLIVHAEGPQTQSVRTQIREFGAAALLWPPPVRDDGTKVTDAVANGGDEIAWAGHASSIFLIKDDAAAELSFRSTSDQDCYVQDATLVGESAYAIVACPSSAARLVRARLGVPPEPIALPPLIDHAPCTPVQIIARAPDDLWVRAACGGTAEKPDVDAVFRSAHPQQPLLF